ncbi:MAG: SIS domain-containing protein [Holosporales bacterium]|jgi:D-sedoheptulose 7-phosphate isomerase|nr:SIS domain-containing protein [Holosporales bacterium]
MSGYCNKNGEGALFSKIFLRELVQVIDKIDVSAVETLVGELLSLRERGGRLFVLGVGGSAASASHAVCDFRKLCDIEAYAATDNIVELSARINDEGWNSVFCEWLKVSKLSARDALLIFSVGGGSLEKNVSVNLIQAVDLAKGIGAKVFGVVGRDGGYTKARGDCVVLVPDTNSGMVTPYTEACHGIIWHCLVSHPKLQLNKTKW